MTEAPNRGLAHCCHHDRHWEWCFDFAGRLDYIEKNKPTAELELRKRLFRLIPEKLLPPQLAEAHAKMAKADAKWALANAEWANAHTECIKAEAEWYKAHAKSDKAHAKLAKAYAKWALAEAESNNAHAEWDKTLITCRKELDALHVKFFPDCPWDGKTIFGGKK